MATAMLVAATIPSLESLQIEKSDNIRLVRGKNRNKLFTHHFCGVDEGSRYSS